MAIGAFELQKTHLGLRQLRQLRQFPKLSQLSQLSQGETSKMMRCSPLISLSALPFSDMTAGCRDLGRSDGPARMPGMSGE